MEDHNLDIVMFSEVIRKQMQANNPPLIKHRRRQFIRLTSHVFFGFEAVAWVIRTLKFSESEVKRNGLNPILNDQQACYLFQKLMDAGLLQNVTNQEEFKNDKSYYRFSADDVESERLIRTVAIGYRLFSDASESSMFEKVCALGTLVSNEALKASQIITWLISDGTCSSREAAVEFAGQMVECGVLKPVDSEVQKLTDGNSFYLFAVDYKRPVLTIEQFLANCRVSSSVDASEEPNVEGSRNKMIHLRQTSENLLDLSQVSMQSSQGPTTLLTRGSVTSMENSQQPNGKAIISDVVPTYQSVLNSDGSVSKAALFHPSSPFVRKDFSIYPDAVGYGFVIRGNGPCFIKVVDPDSPAGKIGLKVHQYIIKINGNDVTEMPHTSIADLILFGPKLLKISVMQDKTRIEISSKQIEPERPLLPSSNRRPSSPLPSAQPWIKNKSYTYPKPARQVSSQ